MVTGNTDINNLQHQTLTWIASRKRFAIKLGFGERTIAQEAGFWWDDRDFWYTYDASTAVSLYKYADTETKKLLDTHKAKLQSSEALFTDKVYPAPLGKDYLAFQKAGIQYILDRPNVLLADDMGLGKTVQIIGVINTDVSLTKCLIVCPGYLKINWRTELRGWLVRDLTVGIAEGDYFPDKDIVIINYDLLPRFKAIISSIAWNLVACDEAHYLKHPEAQRTKMVVGERTEDDISYIIDPIEANRKIMATGTPHTGKTIEMWPLINYLDPATWSSYSYFARRYCSATKTRSGWKAGGESNLAELQRKLRSTIMVRRLKKDVLKDLPEKLRQIVELPAANADLLDAENVEFSKIEAELQALEAKVGAASSDDYARAVEKLDYALKVKFSEMSAVRHKTALLKVPTTVSFVQEALEAGGAEHKIIVFTYHKDVASLVKDGLGENAIIVDGEDSFENRQAAVDMFQNDPTINVIVGTIGAMGTGYTMTAANHVIFAELDWLPGIVLQAEDRAWRIGQKNAVLVQHLVLEGSLDAKMAKDLVRKQGISSQALDVT